MEREREREREGEMLIRFMHFLPCAFTCFMHPQPVTAPPFFREAICNTSPQSIHFFKHMPFGSVLSCASYYCVSRILFAHLCAPCIIPLFQSTPIALMHPSSYCPTDPSTIRKTMPGIFKPIQSSILPILLQSKSNSNTSLSLL